MRAHQILGVLAKAALHPITALQIKACEILLTDPEFADEVEPEALTDSIRVNVHLLDGEAAAFAATHRLPKGKPWRRSGSSGRGRKDDDAKSL